MFLCSVCVLFILMCCIILSSVQLILRELSYICLLIILTVTFRQVLGWHIDIPIGVNITVLCLHLWIYQRKLSLFIFNLSDGTCHMINDENGAGVETCTVNGDQAPGKFMDFIKKGAVSV